MASDDSCAIIYSPTQRTLTVDLSQLSGATIDAWWVNPSNGSASYEGSHATSGGSHEFVTPSGDWVLVLDDQASGYAPLSSEAAALPADTTPSGMAATAVPGAVAVATSPAGATPAAADPTASQSASYATASPADASPGATNATAVPGAFAATASPADATPGADAPTGYTVPLAGDWALYYDVSRNGYTDSETISTVDPLEGSGVLTKAGSGTISYDADGCPDGSGMGCVQSSSGLPYTEFDGPSEFTTGVDVYGPWTVVWRVYVDSAVDYIDWGWWLQQSAPATRRMFEIDTSTGAFYLTYTYGHGSESFGTVSVDAWHTICVTHDGSGTYRVSIDGSEIAGSPFSGYNDDFTPARSVVGVWPTYEDYCGVPPWRVFAVADSAIAIASLNALHSTLAGGG